MIQHSDSTAMAQRQQRHEQAMNELNRLQSENDDLRAEVEELREYRRLAYRDPLTGLRNRRYLDERMREEMQRARRHTNPTFSVLLFDLNDFKRINDEHGHAVGDECLRFIARFLEDNLRDHDVCCRTGGDEFTAILPESDAAGAELLVARLRASLARVNATRAIPVHVSVGAATWPEDGGDGERLIEAADRAMFHDKARQRGPRRPRSASRDRTLPWTGMVAHSE
jgi:diguanylate cyclase (GGDEF)-like protein